MDAPSTRALTDWEKRSLRSSCRYRGACASHRPQMCFPWMRKGRKRSSSFAFFPLFVFHLGVTLLQARQKSLLSLRRTWQSRKKSERKIDRHVERVERERL